MHHKHVQHMHMCTHRIGNSRLASEGNVNRMIRKDLREKEMILELKNDEKVLPRDKARLMRTVYIRCKS